MRASAGFNDEIWCKDLTYVDKLAKDNNGVKYLLVCQDLFDRTVDAKGMTTRDSKEAVKAFSKMIIKKNKPKTICVELGTEFAGKFKNFYSSKGIEIFLQLETKAKIAERTERSLKNVLYRYMEDYGYKYIHKSPHFIVPMNSRNNRSIDMKHNHVKNSDFMSILYSKPLREYNKPEFGIGDRVCIFKYDLPFNKVINHNLHKKFSKLLPLLLAIWEYSCAGKVRMNQNLPTILFASIHS